jgi:hypothetical protein
LHLVGILFPHIIFLIDVHYVIIRQNKTCMHKVVIRDCQYNTRRKQHSLPVVLPIFIDDITPISSE